MLCDPIIPKAASSILRSTHEDATQNGRKLTIETCDAPIANGCTARLRVVRPG